MKKKVFALFACMVFTLALAAGCGNKTDTAPETPDTPETPITETEPIDPLTEDEILSMYTDASDIYADISMVNFAVDGEKTILKNDNTYYKITDERFESYDDFQKYLMQYFTEDLTNELLDDTLFTEGKDGHLYVVGAGRGTNIFYAGYALGEPVISEDAITFDVTAYYTMDEPYEGDLFDNKFIDSDEFETEVYTFRMVPEDGAWKFDTFKIFY